MRTLAVAMLAVAMTACSGGSKHVTPTPTTVATGSIVGHMGFICGPLHGCTHEIPLVGDVTITRAGSKAVVARLKTDSQGRFRVTVPADSYVVEGRTKTVAGTLDRTVTVRPHATATASLVVLAS
jgi:hypothetical protein